MIAKNLIRNAWYVAGLSGDFIVDKIQGQTIARKPIVSWRARSGKIVAFDNRCAHKRMILSEGRILKNGYLECPYHGLCYDDSGACVAVPSHPDGFIPPQAKLRPYPVIEQDGIVWIWPGDPAKSAGVRPVRTPELADKDWVSVPIDPSLVSANYLLLIENLLDITHFYPLHDGNVGDVENSKIPVEIEEGTIDGNHYVGTIRRAQHYRQPPYFVDWFGYEIVDREHRHCMMSPGITRVTMRLAPPGKLGTEAEKGYVLYHMHTPIDEKSHIWRACINSKDYRNDDSCASVARRYAETFTVFGEQDRWVLEKQQLMFDYPDDGYVEVYLRPDKALRRARQIFSQLEREEADCR